MTADDSVQERPGAVLRAVTDLVAGLALLEDRRAGFCERRIGRGGGSFGSRWRSRLCGLRRSWVGRRRRTIRPGRTRRIRVSRSQHRVHFLHPRGWSYYATLRRKLHWHEGVV